MRNEQIDGLTINHSIAPLFEQEWMWTLNTKEMESSFKIDLKYVSWCMFMKDAYRPKVPVTARLSKERCINNDN